MLDCALALALMHLVDFPFSVKFVARYARSFPTISSSLHPLVILFVLALSLRQLLQSGPLFFVDGPGAIQSRSLPL